MLIQTSKVFDVSKMIWVMVVTAFISVATMIYMNSRKEKICAEKGGMNSNGICVQAISRR